MPSQYMSVPVHKIPGDKLNFAVSLQKTGIVAIRNEADILAVRFSGVSEARRSCQCADSRFVVFSHRQQQAAQPRLGEGVEKIALILPQIPPPQQLPAAGAFLPAHPGVMPRGDVWDIQLVRTAGKGLELDCPVALDAGIGRAASTVALHKIVHHAPAESMTEIEDIVVHTQPAAGPAGILHRFQGAAGSFLGFANILIVI